MGRAGIEDLRAAFGSRPRGPPSPRRRRPAGRARRDRPAPAGPAWPPGPCGAPGDADEAHAAVALQALADAEAGGARLASMNTLGCAVSSLFAMFASHAGIGPASRRGRWRVSGAAVNGRTIPSLAEPPREHGAVKAFDRQILRGDGSDGWNREEDRPQAVGEGQERGHEIRQGRQARQWSARKAQMASSEYKKEGGGYEGKKSDDNHLKQWTEEEWGTKSGKESGKTGEPTCRRSPRRAVRQGIRRLDRQEAGRFEEGQAVLEAAEGGAEKSARPARRAQVGQEGADQGRADEEGQGPGYFGRSKMSKASWSGRVHV